MSTRTNTTHDDLAGVIGFTATLRLAAVQLHGQAEFGELRRGLPSDCEIWGAVSVGNGKLDRPATDRLVFDNGPGGTSRAFDWNLIEGHPDLARALVAGGIGPANVRAAAQLGAYAVDVGSSVDEVPGVKSGSKIQSLFDALRPAGRKELLACA